MSRKFALLGTLLTAISIALGAFGAHALKSILPMESLTIFETGVRYQFMHSIALIVLSLYISMDTKSDTLHKVVSFNKVGNLFLVGMALFSGSLYGLSFQPLFQVSYKMILGPVTPLGGVCFILGWGLWGYQIYRSK
jgi:uncharacterized membrane protein YgdD (TMEM256/DUF423 family)